MARRHIPPQAYERCVKELGGECEVTCNRSSNLAQVPKHGFIQGGRVIRIDQGAKAPHYAIQDRDGNIVYETTSHPSAMRRRLERYENREVERFGWAPLQVTGPDGRDYGDRMICDLKVKPATRATAADPPLDAVYLDTETTGLDPEHDEILQLSIIDQDGNVLWDRKYRPRHVREWAEAEAVNHISREDVMGRPPITSEMPEIQRIFDRAKKVYAWNAVFDMAFLAQAGLELNPEVISDTMDSYAQAAGRRHYYKLSLAALECGYTYDAHDSLEDTKALKVVQDHLDRQGIRAPEPSMCETTPVPAVTIPSHASTSHRIARGILIALDVVLGLVALFFLLGLIASIGDAPVVAGCIITIILCALLILLCEMGRRRL